MIQRDAQALRARYLPLPAQEVARPADVRLADLGVVLRQRAELDRAAGAREGANLLGELQNRHLVRVAEIHRLVEVGLEQTPDSLDEVADVAEAACLRAVAVDRQRL